MDIRFISSLTPDDEERLAPGIVSSLSMLLDQLPLAYTLRIETAGGKVFQHAHAGFQAEPPALVAERRTNGNRQPVS